MLSNKIDRGIRLEKLELGDTNNGYLLSHSQLTEKDKGNSRLKSRNDCIYGDLVDFAKSKGSKVIVNKSKGSVYYTVANTGITICLVDP